jgi:UDP-N-acetylmuramyl tripeptide synthase
MTALERMRLGLALVAVRLVAWALRAMRRGGAALPGRVGQALAPGMLGRLAERCPNGVALVTGTNGKTTTAHLLERAMSESGVSVVRNRSGANLLSGLIAAIALAPAGTELAVLETDEATVPRAAREIRPRVIAVSNFFRDQLDRYGELTTAVEHVKRGLASLRPDGAVVLNADDPNVAALAPAAPRTVFFGLEGDPAADLGLGDGSDARRCPVCGAPLTYLERRYAHLGNYRCDACGFARPPLDLVVRVGPGRPAMDGQALEFEWRGEAFRALLPLPGTYNAYNAGMAAAAALALGAPADAVARSLGDAPPSFGRMEALVWRGRAVRIALVKNPAGFNQVLATMTEDAAPKDAVILINDRYADGRDVSWLWDVDFERLVASGAVERIWVGGTRARDMAVRLKYAGAPADRVVRVDGPPAAALAAAAADAEAEGRRLYVLPTYTALLAVRGRLVEEGVVRHFREG